MMDNDLNPQQKIILRNMHIKLEIHEDKGATARKAVEDYCVLIVYTKTYSKWYLYDEGKQTWKKGINKGKYCVLTRMVHFDYLMGMYRDAKPARFVKWGKKSMFVLCDASSIVDVVQKLDT